jgi:hypothetical protein
MKIFAGTIGLLLCSLASAAPTGTETLGISFDSQGEEAPLLKLEHATHRATYDNITDVSGAF